MITLQNVWNKREEFLKLFKEQLPLALKRVEGYHYNKETEDSLEEIERKISVQKTEVHSVYLNLVKADTEEEFYQIFKDEFFWIYLYVYKFGLTYDKLSYFKNGYAQIFINKKCGLINIYGNVLVPPIFDDVQSIVKDLSVAVVRKNKKKGIYSFNKRLILDCLYDEIIFSKFGFIMVVKNQKIGFMNNELEWLTELKFDMFSRNCFGYATMFFLSYGYALVFTDGKIGIFDKAAKISFYPLISKELLRVTYNNYYFVENANIQNYNIPIQQGDIVLEMRVIDKKVAKI